MNDLTILHLSDLHIDGQGRTYSELLKNLLNDIKGQFQSLSNHSFVLVITGDIINIGARKAINNAKKFFNDIKNKIGDRLLGIYIVPGNHDKYRSKENELLIPSYRSYLECKFSYYPEREKSGKPGFSDEYFEKLWEKQKDTYKESGYNELINYIYDELFPEFKEMGDVVKDTFGVHVLEIEGKKFCFILFNTAWSCIDDYDYRHILIGDFQMKRIKEKYDELTDEEEIALTLAMGHHPLNFLYGSEQDSVFNNLIFKESICSEVYMCGHTHDRDIINWSNTNHTMYTLMTGIGWPDKDVQNQQYHYYSIYNFNLDLNSLDIYVRSTRGDKFRPDLSIYGENDDTVQLVRAIRPNLHKSAITISTAGDVGIKAMFPSFHLQEANIRFSQAIGKVSAAVRMIMVEDFYDLLDNCVIPLDDETRQDYIVEALLYDRFYDIISDADYNIDLDRRLVPFFEHPTNKELIIKNFDSFFQRLCQLFSEELLIDQSGSTIRFHFRYLRDKASLIYSELCSSFSREYEPNDMIQDMGYGDLLEAAFTSSVSKSLIYSVNEKLCKQKLENKEKWKNFITIVPDFAENIYQKKRKNASHKDYPFITFGITVDNHQDDNLLYLLDINRMDIILSDIMKTYVRCFAIKMDEYCSLCKKG